MRHIFLKRVSGIIHAALLAIFFISGARNARAQFVKAGDPFGTRCFIENRGQFDARVPNGWRVQYAYLHELEAIFFCEEGLAIEYSGAPFKKDLLKAAERGQPWAVDSIKPWFVYIAFEDARRGVNPDAGDLQRHYFTYGGPEYNSRTFKKITYRDLYPNIDLEYVIPDDRRQGVKYGFVLHPGAKADDIKLRYTGTVDELTLKEGAIQVKSRRHTLTDHKPFSWSESTAGIPSAFRLKKNLVTFDLDVPSPVREKVIIDPWLTPVTTLTSTSYGYDVDYDAFGNVFVYGGTAPCKLAKYNSTGTLVWTFSGTMVTPSWNTSGVGGYASNFVAIPSTGHTYLGQALVTSGPTIIRLDAAGNYDNFMSIAEPTWREIWDLANHCSTGKIYGLGGSTGSKQSGGIVNPGTGSITPISFFNLGGTCCNDIVSYAIDSKGEMFWLFASASSTAINNHLARIDAPFTSSVWISPSTFTTMSEAANHTGFVGSTAGSNAFNALAVNDTFLYYYDGLNLAAYNKSNGALRASVIIPGHLKKAQGGIAVDQCNNVYVGGNDSVLCYHYDGNVTFSRLPAIPLGIGSSTLFAGDVVCDIRLNTSMLFVSGQGFVGVYNAPHSNTCPTSTNSCYGSINPNYGICAGNSVAVTVGNPWGLANPSYSLMPGSATSASGSFAVSPTVTTVYTIYVTGTDPFNAVLTSTSLVTVNVHEQPSAAPVFTQASCSASLTAVDLNLTFFPPVVPSYSVGWTPLPAGITSNTQTAVQHLAPGPYTVLIGTGYCSATAFFTIDPIPLPVQFAIVPGNQVELSCTTPMFTFAMVPPVNSYTTTNGINAPLLGAAPVFSLANSPGTYTVFAEGGGNTCPSSQTLAVTMNTAVPVPSVSPLYQVVTCAASSMSPVIASGTPTINITHMWQAPQGSTLVTSSPVSTFVPGAPGVYVHCLTDNTNGCKACTNFTVFSNSAFPVFNVVSPQNFSVGCGPTATASINFKDANTTPPGGSVSYTLLSPGAGPVPSTGALSGVAAYQTTVPGTYTAITRDAASGCDTKVYFSVIQNTLAPEIDTVVFERDVITCANPTVSLYGISGTGNVSYEWQYESSSQAGQQLTVGITADPTRTLMNNYTLQVTDNSNRCISQSVIPIYQNIFAPTPSISGLEAFTCITTTILLTNSSQGNIPPQFNPSGPIVGFLWEGPNPQLPKSLSTSYIASMPGIYTMTAMDSNNGCVAKSTKAIADGRVFPIINVPEPPPPFVISCTTGNATLSPYVGPEERDFIYQWIPVPDAVIQGLNTGTLVTNQPGRYMVHITDAESGCEGTGMVDAIPGSVDAAFSATPLTGYAPLEVEFTNHSELVGHTSTVNALWSFGVDTVLNASSEAAPKIRYEFPGTYTVLLYVSAGPCLDSAALVVNVETPSWLRVPNIFTPNGDGVNDEFFVHSSNLSQLSLKVYDRWGNEVFVQESDKGMVLWNGMNATGKPVSEGTYMYLLKGTGKDGKEYDLQGNITVSR